MSNPWHLAPVLYFVGAVGPSRILDVGVGLGTYGFMVRQHLDIAGERVEKSSWKLQIDGVEIFKDYRNPIWDYAYDQVLVGDIRELVSRLPNYDVILCNDVLEHFPLEEAKQLVKNLLELAPVIIATTPNIDWPQGAWGGNDAETHRCLFRSSDMPGLVVAMKTGPTSVFVAAANTSAKRIVKDASIGCPVPHVARFRNLIQRACRKVRRILQRHSDATA